MQAILLAGGFGNRLRTQVSNVPKPMAPVAGRPFLAWLLEYMQGQGVCEAVLCVHYMHEAIQRYFGNRFASIDLHYSIEESPLGTGGAIRQAILQLDPKEPVLALNGDSLVQLDYKQMLQNHKDAGRLATLAARHVPDCSRYSQLTLQGNLIERYDVLGGTSPGLISTGFYIIEPQLFVGHALSETFSFERDFLAPHVPQLLPAAFDGVEYFIDIGVPDDYQRAQAEIPERLGVRLAA